jgi:EAL domain-containing protein (putative c-di-GMP-specific phosphodiesterase class I)
LARAIDQDELALHYQPVVDLHTGAVAGFEALSRWHHPQLGLLGADAFVPVAESYGLSRPLTDWVLRRACTQLASWQADVLVTPEFRVAVNISVDEMDGDGIVGHVARAVETAGVDPRGLVVEIAETRRVDGLADAIRTIDGLHELGVGVAVDNFGSPDAAFPLLCTLPVDELKLDRHLVSETTHPAGRALVGTLIRFGRELGTRVVAEGVETSDQAALLRSMGCAEGQGFLWAPALPVAEAERHLSAVIHAASPCRGVV